MIKPNFQAFSHFLGALEDLGLYEILSQSTHNAMTLRVLKDTFTASFDYHENDKSAHEEMMYRRVEHDICALVERYNLAFSLTSISKRIESSSGFSPSTGGFRMTVRHDDEKGPVFTLYPGRFNKPKFGPTMLRYFGRDSFMMRDLWLLVHTPSSQNDPTWIVFDDNQSRTYKAQNVQDALVRHAICLPSHDLDTLIVKNDNGLLVSFDASIIRSILQHAQRDVLDASK